MDIPALPFCGLEIWSPVPFLGIENPQSIGEHIKNRRLFLKLFQSDIAKILNVSEDTITYWENGRSYPQIKHYPKLIQFLGYSPFITETQTLGGRIKKYRIETGTSQEKLAAMIGVDETSILAWETNIRKPLPSKMKLLQKLINQKELL